MAISIGNFYNSGGKNLVGGAGGSGIDTKTLVEGLIAARQVPVTQITDRITANTNKSKAFTDLKSLMSKLKDSADLLRNVPGFAKQSSNAFDFRTTSVASNTSVSGSTYMTVTAEPGAQVQDYTIDEISQLAKGTKQLTGTFAIANANTSAVTASATANFFKAGTFTFKGESITLETGDSLNLVAAKFNAVRSATGVTATVIKVADNNFKLQLAGDETGLSNAFDIEDSGTVTDATGVLANLTVTTPQAAQNAKFKLDGGADDIERETNEISDVITGITFNLKQETPALTELTVSIDADTTVAKNAVIGFMNAYNDVRIFAAKQSQVGTDGKYTEESVLATDSTLRAMLSSVSNELSGIVAGISGNDPKRLSDLGITFTDLQETDENPFTRSILTFNEGKLDTALASDFDNVRKVFEFSFQSSNPNLAVFTRTNALSVSSFSLEIQPTNVATKQRSSSFAIVDADTAVVTAAPTSGFFTAGTFTLNGQSITFNDGDTLNMIVNKFNAVRTSTGISAAAVEIGTNDFKLEFTAVTAGTAGAFDINAVGTLTDPSSVFSDITVATTQTAKNQKFQATYTDGSGSHTTNLTATAFASGTGYSLIGQTGTVLEGLNLLYGVNTAATMTVNLSQGIGDRLYNLADSVLKDETGSIWIEQDALKTRNEKLQSDVDRMNAQIEVYRQQLLDRFAALEAAIARSNNILDSIAANNDAQNGNN